MLIRGEYLCANILFSGINIKVYLKLCKKEGNIFVYLSTFTRFNKIYNFSFFDSSDI